MRIKLAVVGLVFIVLVAVSAVAAPLVAPYPPNSIKTFKAQPPSVSHLLGTDVLGRDQLSRLVYGARTSIVVSALAAAFGVLAGGTIGLAAAYYRGIVDSALMRTVDAMLSIPGLLLPLTMVAILGGSVFTVSLTLGITFSPSIARLVRAHALSQLQRDYVLSAQAAGAGSRRVMFRHVAPNCTSPVLVAASLGMGAAVIAESALSFLGAGVTPPTATWGSMLATGFTYLRIAPWIALTPGVAIFLLVLSFSFVGDGLRDALDPRLRGAI